MLITENRSASSRPDSPSIQGFFDAIAERYDFLNQFLSFRLDEVWRRKAVEKILSGTEATLLDLGVGTGKFTKLFLEGRKWKRVAGVDFSAGMLEEAKKQLPETVELIQTDFHQLPFDHGSFDLVVSSFTLRSVQNMDQFLQEVHRILSPDGKAAFLCLTRPNSLAWKVLYYPYLKFYLPLVGGLISGNRKAYQFLSESIQSFQDPSRTKMLMRQAGFTKIESFSFSFGMATLILGHRSP